LGRASITSSVSSSGMIVTVSYSVSVTFSKWTSMPRTTGG
jgi:hypothetical protein